MHKWKPLQSGDTIDIIAPGYGIEVDDLPKVVETVEALGFKAHIPDNLLGADTLFAHNHPTRLRHLKDAFTNTESKAIWCLKGGYGTAWLLDELAELDIPQYCKPVIGFSDITALHLFLNQTWRWPTLHGPVLWQLVRGDIDERSSATLCEILLGQMGETVHTLTPINAACNPDASMTGKVIGGNLATLQCSIGTAWAADTKEKFLLLEDVDEPVYRIDRMLLHLKQSGIVDNTSAILLGDFHGKDQKEDDVEAITRILQLFADYIDTPVYRISQIGHGRTHLTIPLGTRAILQHTTLVCESGYENR